MPRTLRLLLAPLIVTSLLLIGCGDETYSTPLELAQGDVLTSYEDQMTFLAELQAETGAFTMDTIGTSVDGRSLVVLRFEAPAENASPDGRLKVLVYAQQHGNEPSGKEAAIELARDIATGTFSGFGEAVDFYLIPQVNPDGSELEQRRNVQDKDLNRDHLPLFTPEVTALHAFYNQMRPHVTLDVHEYGFAGSTWVEAGWHKNFGQQIGGMSNANMSMTLRSYAWDRVIPWMKDRLAPKDVILQRYLVTDGPEARFRYSTAALNDGRNSMGIYHSLSFLIEGRNGIRVEADIRERTRQQLETIKAFLSYFGANADEVKAMVDEERTGLLGDASPGEVALVMDYVPDPERPSTSVGVIEIETGEEQTLVIDAFHPLVEATLWVDRPLGYAVPADQEAILQVLERHGLELTRVGGPTAAILEKYVIERVTPANKEDKEFLEVDVSSAVSEGSIPEGDVIVWCDQLGTNLIVSMLEPQSQWGLAPLPEFAHLLEEGTTYPIKRIVGVPE